VPIAGNGKIVDDRFTLTGLVADVDGSRIIKSSLSGSAKNTEAIGVNLADQLLARGAAKILEGLEHES
jgi:hydroxymethylbilane synthase